MGQVRSLNLWLSLSRCGDEAPGLDIVPRRLERYVATATEEAVLDYTISQQQVEQAAGGTPIIRPIFEPGDALFFDELFLHQTGSDPAMPNPRYAVENWFFGGLGVPGRVRADRGLADTAVDRRSIRAQSRVALVQPADLRRGEPVVELAVVAADVDAPDREHARRAPPASSTPSSSSSASTSCSRCSARSQRSHGEPAVVGHPPQQVVGVGLGRRSPPAARAAAAGSRGARRGGPGGGRRSASTPGSRRMFITSSRPRDLVLAGEERQVLVVGVGRVGELTSPGTALSIACGGVPRRLGQVGPGEAVSDHHLSAADASTGRRAAARRLAPVAEPRDWTRT